jgi:hypothetical protein
MCIIRSHQALSMVQLEGRDEAQSQKLHPRIAKAKMHSYEASKKEQHQRMKLLKNLPRYRPSMYTTTEYFGLGHDTATSIFEGFVFEEFESDLKRVSFFFGGVGDGRHFLQTLIRIADHEKTKTGTKRTYNFTVNDMGKHAISRDLIIWILLDDLSRLDAGSDDASILLNTIFFIYVSAIMPSYAFEQLNQTISRVLDALTNGRQPLKWLYLHDEDFPKYVEALCDWQGKMKDFFTSGEMITKVSEKMAGRDLGDQFRKEHQLYFSTAVLYPAKKVLQQHDPKMLELIQRHSTKLKVNFEAFTGHAREHWHFNTTLIDVEWYENVLAKQGKFDRSV